MLEFGCVTYAPWAVSQGPEPQGEVILVAICLNENTSQALSSSLVPVSELRGKIYLEWQTWGHNIGETNANSALCLV